MTTTTDIARAHGHNGPTNCQDCGTTESVHFGSWFDPETKESGNFLLCCSCAIKGGDPVYVHSEDGCSAPAARYVPNINSDPCGQLAFKRIQERAVEAYIGARHQAAVLDLEGREADEHAIAAVLESVGRAYAAAAVTRVAETLIDKLDEDTYVALGDIAATLDLDVIEDLDGANGTGEATPGVRVLHRADGWTLRGEPGPEACTSNHHRQQDGRPACTDTAVWKVVEDHGMHLTLSFWCDTDLPAKHQPGATPPRDAAR